MQRIRSESPRPLREGGWGEGAAPNRRRPVVAIAAIAAFALAAPAAAATLRPMTTLHSSVVKLSDLFDDAGPRADRVLGPAPAPGGRIIVESRQLAAIAREFGVPWHPEAGDERAVLERPGRPLAREELIAALVPALVSAGAPADAAIDLPSFEAPLVPADGNAAPIVTRLDYDAASGRFTAALATGDVAWRVSGRAVPMLDVPVPLARLLPGTVLRESDLHMVRIPAGRVPAGAVRAIADAVGKQLRYQAAAGAPLLAGALRSPRLVQRNARVLIIAESPGLALSAEGRALDDGAAGDHVRVLNTASRAILDAEVIGEARVRVDPEAPPLETARPGTPYGTEPVP